MFCKIKNEYRMACIAFGKRSVNTILLVASLACLYVEYRNHFDFQKK